MTSSNANIFCVTGPLCGEFTAHWVFPAQKASNAENVSIWWCHHVVTIWWRHDMETLSALLAICQGNPPVTCRVPADLTAGIVVLIIVSYTLSREYRVVRNRYSRLIFTCEDRLCANLRVQEQSTNMTSQCQCFAFTWRHRSTVMTSQC